MGLFSGVKKIAKKVNKTAAKAGKQFTQNARNSSSTFQAIGTLGAAPVSIAMGSVGAGLSAAAPVIGQATKILADNPALAGLAGGALGIPGLGSLFGEPATGAAAGTGGMFSELPTASTPAAGIPLWLWIVGGLGAALGLFLFIRRKS